MTIQHIKNIRRVLFVLIVGTLAFIWGHSLMPRTTSAAESGWFVKTFSDLWKRFSLSADMADHLVRKAAHLTEYFCLGFELFLYHSLKWMPREKRHRPPLTLAAVQGIFVALIDETLQIFSIRGSMVSDVWLDFVGICFGAAVAKLGLSRK